MRPILGDIFTTQGCLTKLKDSLCSIFNNRNPITGKEDNDILLYQYVWTWHETECESMISPITSKAPKMRSNALFHKFTKFANLMTTFAPPVCGPKLGSTDKIIVRVRMKNMT